MDTNSVAERLRELRRRRGMNQEELAENAGVSVNVVRKVEQGGSARLETYHAFGRVLGVRTVWFLASEPPEPRSADHRDGALTDIRSVVNPPVSFSGPLYSPDDDTPLNLPMLQRAVKAVAEAYQSDRYDDLATITPSMLRSAQHHVNALEGNERLQAQRVRGDALQLAGRYLIQVREHDLALIALRRALSDALDAEDQSLAAAVITQQAWALMRQARFDDVERLCVDAADKTEPRMSTAAPEQLASWGYLLMRASAAAARNNRIEEARELQRVAASAAIPLREEYNAAGFLMFGPVKVGMQGVENEVVAGNPERALGLANELPAGGGGVSPNTRQRSALDRAKAHVQIGNVDEATSVLVGLRKNAPNWLRHQMLGRDIAEDILNAPKRMPTRAQRDLADFMQVPV